MIAYVSIAFRDFLIFIGFHDFSLFARFSCSQHFSSFSSVNPSNKKANNNNNNNSSSNNNNNNNISFTRSEKILVLIGCELLALRVVSLLSEVELLLLRLFLLVLCGVLM